MANGQQEGHTNRQNRGAIGWAQGIFIAKVRLSDSLSIKEVHMQVHVRWGAALLAALGIQKALGNKNPILSGLTGFVLVFIISYVYFFRPVHAWGEWDPPMKEVDSRRVSKHRGDIEVECNAKDEETNILLCSEEVAEGNQEEDTEAEAITQTIRKEVPKARVERIHFLSNVKIFLTFVVVAFHVTGSFGGFGKNWALVVGLYEQDDNMVRTILYGFNMINQSYFMSLFFFISGFFTPSNYERKGGEQFVKDRARRLLVPALMTTFVLVPLTTMCAQWTAAFPMLYIPYPGHAWFIYWLLLFEWAYVTIRKDTLGSNEPSQPFAFPNTKTRCVLGLLWCGLATFLLAMKANVKIFFSMPTLVPGSLFCDILLFFAGTVAKESGWISSELRIADQLDLPLKKFRQMVLTEGLVIFLLKISRLRIRALDALFFITTGLFCIDMSICVLQFFQQYANKPPPALLSDAAFTVYLIHPLVITVCTSIFAKTYNELYDDRIQFDPKLGGIFPISESHLSGPIDGKLHYFIGFLIVFFMSNAIVWPTAWILRKLPILNQYL